MEVDNEARLHDRVKELESWKGLGRQASESAVEGLKQGASIVKKKQGHKDYDGGRGKSSKGKMVHFTEAN